MDLTRRKFGKAAVGVLGGTFSAAVATAAAFQHLEEKPDSVTITYDEDWLATYQPKLVVDHLDVQPYGMYAWKATSNDYEFDYGVYCAAYSHQEGVSPVKAALFPFLSDSHFGDHEWYYVAVDDSGNVDHVIPDVYHWIAGSISPPDLQTVDDTHPVTKVVQPWHMYKHDSVDASRAEFVSLGELGDWENVEGDDVETTFEDWLDRGLAESLEPGTVVDPARMSGPERRRHWWRNDGEDGFTFNAFYARQMYRAGLFGASSTEPKTIGE